jgi:hypothetical protein
VEHKHIIWWRIRAGFFSHQWFPPKLNPPKSVFTKRGIYLQRAEFVRLAENLLQLKEVWGGLADTSPCSDQHASDEEKRECDHCTPKPPPEDSDSEAEEDPLIRAGNTNRRGRKRMPAWDEDPYSRVPEKRHASCFDEISSKISQACPQEDIVISDEDLDIDGDEPVMYKLMRKQKK